MDNIKISLKAKFSKFGQRLYKVLYGIPIKNKERRPLPHMGFWFRPTSRFFPKSSNKNNFAKDDIHTFAETKTIFWQKQLLDSYLNAT